MSHIDPGPLATYESLADPHLTGYFNNSRMRRHLRRMGLITSKGNIVSEKVFRLNNARKEHQRHVRDVLAQAIIHKALDMERHRQMHIKKQLEEIGKVERVRRVRAERALRGDEDILPLLIPKGKGKKQHKKEKVPILEAMTSGEDHEQYPQSVGYPAIPGGAPYNTRTDRMKTPYPDVEIDNQHLNDLDREALRSFTLNLSHFDLGSGVSPYSVPPMEQKNVAPRKKRRRPATAIGTVGRNKLDIQRPKTNSRSLRLHRKEPPMMHRTQIHSMARVTFKYLGKMVHLDHEEEDPRDEVVVMQQHCGGENLTVFKKLVMKGDNFMIISKRHRNFPFSLTFYLNGVQVERLSTCCEYKHKRGRKLGAKSSHFGIVRVEGSQPCFKCLISQGKLKTRPDPIPPPTKGPSKPTRRRRNELKGVDKPKPEEEYEEDFTKSSEKSSEQEVHHDAGKEDSEDSSDSSDSSTISDVSESEDEDGGGHLSSDTESKERYDEDSDTSTASSESVDSQKKVDSFSSDEGKKLKAVKKPLSPPPKIVTPPPVVPIAKAGTTPNKVDTTPPRSKTPTPKSATPQQSKSSKESTPTESKEVTSASDTDTSVSVKEKVEEKRDADKKSNILQQLTDAGSAIPERPTTPEPDSESESSSSSDSETSEVRTVRKKPIESSPSDNRRDNTRKHNGSILPLLEGKNIADLSNIKLDDEQISEFTEFFKKNPSSLRINQLILEGCDLGDTNGKKILRCLRKGKQLRALDLSNNNLTGECAEHILEICKMNSIDNLSLENNPLKDEGCAKITAGFLESQKSIVMQKLQKRVSRDLIASVLKDSVREMSGDENGMSSASSMSSLASTAMAESVALESLNIAHTGAGEDTMEILKEYLSLNPNLVHLNISRNALSAKSLDCLLKPLSDRNTVLKTLIMDQTSLDDEDAEMIAEKLKWKSALKELSLRENEITNIGAEKLMEYRKTNASLKSLHLTPGNKISTDLRL